MHLSSFSSTAQIFCFLCQEHAAALLELPHLTPSMSPRRPQPLPSSPASSPWCSTSPLLWFSPSPLCMISKPPERRHHAFALTGRMAWWPPMPPATTRRFGCQPGASRAHFRHGSQPLPTNLFPQQERQEFCIPCGGS